STSWPTRRCRPRSRGRRPPSRGRRTSAPPWTPTRTRSWAWWRGGAAWSPTATSTASASRRRWTPSTK
ncbi:unnamed protein product, partial [Gadus morhua 'NCC']